MTNEKILFEMINDLSEGVFGKVHIINTSEPYLNDAFEGKFRVYHADGYCFDIEKVYVCEPAEISNYEFIEDDGYTYSFFSEYEGFKQNSISDIIELLKNTQK